MTEEPLRRAADAAITPMVASLAPWGVLDCHWLPDRNGDPVVWLRVGTEIERVLLEAQVWLLPQVQVLLARVGMPPSQVLQARLEVTSAEAQDGLFDG